MDASLALGQMSDRSLSGRVLIGRYRLGERIGRGELGDVYMADDLARLSISDDAAVAVKVFHESLVSMCGGVREMAPSLASACRLSHPNVINAYDFYRDGETLFLAMERLDGITLAERLAEARDGPPLTVAEADAALREIVDALVHMHATTTTPLLRLNPHRIRLAGESRQLCVADLGLSCLLDPTVLCQSSMTAGTATYMAPEVVAAKGTPDRRADQFSLGALAMALFTGSPRGSTEGLHRMMDRTEAAIWIDLLPRLLAERPEDRFDELGELQEILLSAATDKHGRNSKSKSKRRTRSLLAGTAGSAANSGISWWIRKPLLLATSGVIGLSLAYAAWALGPDLLFKVRSKSKVTTQIDEARRHLHEIDSLRMVLLTKGLNRAPFDAAVRELADAKPDYALIDALGAAAVELANSENDSAQVLLSSVRASLSERMELFHDAAVAIDASDRLMELRATASEFGEVIELPGAATTGRIDEAWRQAANEFGGGDFRLSAATANEAVRRAEQALGSALHERRTEAHAARDAWVAALRDTGDFPEIEPIGEPGKQIAAGDTASASGAPVEATRRFTAARNRYRLWADELMRAIPGDNQEDASVSKEKQEQAMVRETFTNSLGMRFVRVRDLMASVWETRLIDYLAFTYDTGVDAGYLWRDFAVTGTSWRAFDDEGSEDVASMWGDYSITPVQGPCHPVTLVSSADAQRFCEWLTRRERQSGLIRDDLRDAEKINYPI
jgi:serine/threonine protein kinase